MHRRTPKPSTRNLEVEQYPATLRSVIVLFWLVSYVYSLFLFLFLSPLPHRDCQSLWGASLLKNRLFEPTKIAFKQHDKEEFAKLTSIDRDSSPPLVYATQSVSPLEASSADTTPPRANSILGWGTKYRSWVFLEPLPLTTTTNNPIRNSRKRDDPQTTYLHERAFRAVSDFSLEWGLSYNR